VHVPALGALKTRLAGFRGEASARLGERLLKDVTDARSLRPHLTGPKILGYLIAATVHLATVVIAALGILLIVRTFPNPFLLALGVLLLLIAFVLRPRVPQLRDTPTPRERLATLLELTGRVARELGTPNVDYVVVGPEYNAAVSRVGWRRRRVLYLELPLFLALEPQERVALLGHELGHNVNGDANRGVVVGTAIFTLATWHRILHHSSRGGLDTFELIAAAIMEVVSYVPRAWLRLLSLLSWRESQRAEYLADHLAATIGGTQAAVSAFAKLQHGNAMWRLVRTAAVGQPETDILQELRRAVALDTGNSAAAADERRIDHYPLESTHPPTPYRIRALRARPALEPAVVLTQAETERLDRELEAFAPAVQRQLLERYRRSLYR
jgi:heat shock protein HtpX